MNMQYGMPSLIEIKSAESCACLCGELGLDFVELSMNLPEYQTDRIDAGQLAGIMERYGIYFTIHLDENLSPCNFNNKVSAAYTETVLQTIEIAKRLGMPVINMHLQSGVFFTLPGRKLFLFEEYEHEYLQKLAAFRDICEKAIGGSGIAICVENCGDFGSKPYIRKSLSLLLESPVFAVTFDIGHNAAADFTDEPVIMEHLDRLHHMHIHDAKEKSNHLALGDGNLDLMKYFSMAQEHNCRVVLEVKTVEGLRKSAAWAGEKGLLK